MLENIFNRLFGSTDEKIIKQLRKKVDKINEIEPLYVKMTNEELQAKTKDIIQKD